MPDLKTYDFFDISPLREYIMAHGQRRFFKRREHFCSQNHRIKEIGMVISGGFSFSRSDYKGDNQILSMAFAGEFISAYISAGSNNRSCYDITALCPSEAMFIDVDEFNDYMDRELGRDYRLKFTEAIALGFMLRAISYRCDSPEERYMELLQRLPGIDSMISMTTIASYLGITRETFARLRRKIKAGSGTNS